MGLEPKRDGQLVQAQGESAIYWINFGMRRHIPDPTTLTNVFGTNPEITNLTVDEVERITLGPPLPGGAALVVDPTKGIGNGGKIYLMDWNLAHQPYKRHARLDDLLKFQLNGQLNELPNTFVADSIPTGPSVEG
jgi:hypothetical protein